MKVTTALGIGALIGATIAILFAPKCGEETRVGLADRVKDSIKRTVTKARDIARQTTEVAAHVNDQVQGVRDALDAGLRAFREARTLCRL